MLRGLFYATLSGVFGALAGTTGKFLSSSIFISNSGVLSVLAVVLLVIFNTVMWTFQVDANRYQSVTQTQSQILVVNSAFLGLFGVLFFEEYQVLTVKWLAGICLLITGTLLF